MPLQPGTIYTPANAEEVRDDFLTDLRLDLLANGVTNPPIQPGTENFIMASALAEMAMMQYANIAVSENDQNALTASGTALDAIREALGLPVVDASASTGFVQAQIVVGGTTTYVAGTQFVLPNGLRGRVTQTYVGLNNATVLTTPLAVETIDKGAATQLAAGTKIRWVSPPLNSKTEAIVLPPGLTGGADKEDDARKRTRIINRLRNVPAGGNWAHIRELALNSLASIQDCYVYPALGGPASVRVVPVVDFDLDNLSFTRIPTDQQLDVVRNALQAALPDGSEISVIGPRARLTDVSFVLTIPNSTTAGGNGQGWVDATPWPPLVVADSNKVYVTLLSAANQIHVSAQTATAPIDGQTHIMWWSNTDMRFYTFLVTAHSGGSGAWVLTLDRSIVDSTGAVPLNGFDWISPACVNAEAYGKSFVSVMSKFGPQENTNDANRLPRSLRHPLATDEQPGDLTTQALVAFASAHSEVTNIAWGRQDVAALASQYDVSKGPGIIMPQRFAVYKT